MYITLLIIILLILAIFCIYYHSKNKIENYFQLDDDDEEIVFDENMAENVQPSFEDLMAKKQLRQQLQKLDSDYTPDYSGSSNCTSRCDCCWKNTQSSDRIIACNEKYKSGSKQLNECLYSNSKYANEACKSKYGKGLFFKSC